MENKDQSQVSDLAVDQEASESTQESKEQYVARKAYEEVSSDMHKFKRQAKEAAAQLAEYEAKLKAIEEDKLKDQERWKELYEREKNERSKAEEIRKQERDLYLRSVKMSALKSELGGRIKDQYLNLANVDAIEVNEDGSLSSESVLAVANAFRKEHPALIPSGESGQITAQAPGAVAQTRDKSVSEMTLEEKIAMLNQMTKRS